MTEIRQGEIHELSSGLRVIVISSDRANQDGRPIAVPIIRGRHDLPPYLIEFADIDPHAGSIAVADMGWIPPDRLGKVVGIVTGATMERIREAVNELIAP